MMLSSRRTVIVPSIIVILFTVSYVVFYVSTSQLSSTTKCDDTNTVKSIEGVSYEKALYDSFGFFDDIDDSHWLEQQRRIRSERLFNNTMNPDAGIREGLQLWFVNNFDPIFTCSHMRRVGGSGDGGKWTCDPHRLANKEDCLIYSVGSKGEYEFEDGIVQLLGKHCEIHVFDPDPIYSRKNDIKTKNIHYHAWGLISTNGLSKGFGDFDFKTFPQTMKELNHENRRIDIFKIDCEGCEWASYLDWVDQKVDIRQILIETHPHVALEINVSVGTMLSTLVKNGFVPFSKEANTHPLAPPTWALFEYSFVRLRPSFQNSSLE